MKNTVKRIIFPGVNLHARDRFRRIPEQFGSEIAPGKRVLDAGCGNGMLSYQAWKSGSDVLGISIKQNEVDKCQRFFNHEKKISEDRLKFRNINLYNFDPEKDKFDAIICTEVLEHIRNDSGICQKFFELLNPGGVLHVTAPNASHPYNETFPLDPDENGGHVRPGYTSETYHELLEPLGFQIEKISGFGGPVRQAFNYRIKETQEKFGAAAGLPLFFLSLPATWIDSDDPSVPFSLYVRSRKPINETAADVALTS